MKPRIEEVDGLRMIKDMKTKLETMLHKKVKAIKVCSHLQHFQEINAYVLLVFVI